MIENDTDLDRALARLDVIWSARPGDADWVERSALVEQISAYEDAHFQIPPPSPEAAAAFRKDQETCTPGQKELVPVPLAGEEDEKCVRS
jgi:HTH-type transcriptional regulator/antitoxin HigA